MNDIPTVITAIGATAVGTAAILKYSPVADYFENYSNMNLISEGEDSYGEECFNGLQTMGGDTTKWRDAMVASRLDDKTMYNLYMKACIIVLEKPANVLFSGMTSKDKNTLSTIDGLYKKGKEEVKMLVAEYKSDAGEQGANQGKLMERLANKCLKYYVGVSGRKVFQFMEEVEGLEEALIDAMDDRILAGNEFGTFFGGQVETRNKILKKGELVRLKDEAAVYLPRMSNEELGKMDPSSLDSMLKSRRHWSKIFRIVNVSRAKRIALLSLQFMNPATRVHQSWIKKHGGRPLSAKSPPNMNKDSKEIFDKMIADFKSEKALWNTGGIPQHFRSYQGSCNVLTGSNFIMNTVNKIGSVLIDKVADKVVEAERAVEEGKKEDARVKEEEKSVEREVERPESKVKEPAKPDPKALKVSQSDTKVQESVRPIFQFGGTGYESGTRKIRPKKAPIFKPAESSKQESSAQSSISIEESGVSEESGETSLEKVE